MKSSNRWFLLTLLAVAQFMVVLDTSIVNVALPAIQKALNFSVSNLQWIITAYTLAFGGFLLLGGRAADLYGRRRVFLLGISGFTLASLGVALSQTETMMIIFRGVQGLAAAFMSPAALSIVLITFEEGKDRNKALGVWSAVAAGGAAAGVLLGGILTQYLGWRWDFFVNVPVGILVVLGGLRFLPLHESEAEHNNLDLPGALLVTSGLMVLVYGLTKAPTWGWTNGHTLAFLEAAVALLAGFIWNESRAKHPLMPLSIFKIRNITGANLTQLPITASLFAMFFFLSLYIQQILGYSPVKSGLSFLPVTIIIGITAGISSNLVGKIGYKPFMVGAPLFMATGLYLLSRTPVAGSYLTDVLPGLAVMALGLGMSFVSITIAATTGVSKQLSGLASGLLNTAQQIGGAIGLAILAGVASASTTSYISSHAASKTILPTALVHGYHSAFHVGMGFAITASLLAFILIKQKRGEQADEGAPLPAIH
jgi:EmrB/QacA subfamily drug resistance transporter